MTPEKHLQHELGEGGDVRAPQTSIAANDSTHGAEQDTRKPLWIVAIGLEVLFGIMAVTLALAS